MNFITAELSNRIAEKKPELRNPDLQNVIRDSLAKGSGGMFQWVRCQIESLCKLRNDNAIRAALFNLPRTLQDTYHRLVQRIEDCHPDDAETFRRVLSWLVRGVRDLTLNELDGLWCGRHRPRGCPRNSRRTGYGVGGKDCVVGPLLGQGISGVLRSSHHETKLLDWLLRRGERPRRCVFGIPVLR